MIKQFFKKLVSLYGIEEDEAEMKKDFYILGCIYVVFYIAIRKMLQGIIADYFLCVGGMMLVTFVCAYFYRKKKNSERFKRVKQISFLVSFGILLVIFSPCLLLYGMVIFVAKTINALYLLKKYLICFFVEVLYHISVIVMLIQITILNLEDLLYLIISYFVFFMADGLLSTLFRILFIRGKNRNYERYKYAMEMDVISEYVFLFITSISIIYTASDYSYAFIPVLLWYSIKQMNNYRREKKNSSMVRSFLIDTLNDIEEVCEIYIEVMNNEELNMSNYIEKTRIDKYILYDFKKKFLNFFKRRHIQEALSSIQSLQLMVYNLPQEKDRAKEDLKRVMDDIVKCI